MTVFSTSSGWLAFAHRLSNCDPDTWGRDMRLCSLAVALTIGLGLTAPSTAQDFSGWYAGIDLGATRSNNEQWTFLERPFYIGGASVGAFVGSNWSVPGGYIIGVEARGRHELGRDLLYVHLTEWQRTESAVESYYSGSLNARFGIPVGTKLYYGRVGAGVASAIFDYENDFFGSGFFHIRDRHTALTFNSGLGAEFHGERVFGRLEGEFRWTNWSRLIDAPRLSFGANVGVGIKF